MLCHFTPTAYAVFTYFLFSQYRCFLSARLEEELAVPLCLPEVSFHLHLSSSCLHPMAGSSSWSQDNCQLSACTFPQNSPASLGHMLLSQLLRPGWDGLSPGHTLHPRAQWSWLSLKSLGCKWVVWTLKKKLGQSDDKRKKGCWGRSGKVCYILT